MLFFWFLLYVFAILTCGSVVVGPFSLRVYMTVMMLGYLLITAVKKKDNKYRINNIYIILFLYCIFGLFISLAINDGLEPFGFWKTCLSHYLVCIVAYFAINRFVEEKSHFTYLIFVISIIVLVDAVVSIMQYLNDPLGWALGLFFSDADEIESFANYLDNHESLVGVSKLVGIFGRPTKNGFMLCVLTPLLMARINKNDFFFVKIYLIIVIVLAVIASVLLQQRAALFLLIAVIIYQLFRDKIKHPGIIISFVALVIMVLLIIGPIQSDFVSESGITDMDNSSRNSIWQVGISTFLHNPLFGDYVQFERAAGYSAHNIIIAAMAYSGIVGFIPFMSLYVKTIYDSLKYLHSKNNTRVFSYSVLNSMGMGLFHNASFLTGEVVIFIVLALMLKSKKIERTQR